MLWSTFIAALALVPCAFAKPIAFPRTYEGGNHHRSQIQRRAANTGTYTVVSGDTGNAIAAVYSITFDTLNSANPNVNWNGLQVGQTLNMPSARAPIMYQSASGDTQSSIANKYDIYNADLGNANPSVNWNSLGAGTRLRVPGYGSYTTYAVASGDTGNVIATAFGISFNTLSAANPNVNWNNLQIGQVLTVPAGVSPTTGSIPSPASPPSSGPTSTTKKTTTAGPTTTPPTTTKASATTTAAGSGEPAVTPTATVTGSNYVQGGNNNDGVSSRADSYTFYQGDGSTGAGWPDKSQWISFATMWNNVSPVLGQSCQSIYGVANNSPQENQYIYDGINAVASNSGVDHRLILATIIQESSGCVRVRTTTSPDGTVTNPGLMQDFNGSGTCNKNGNIQNPCPASQIYQMIEDGTFGTRTNGASSYQAGLVQDINGNGGYTGAQAYYRAARIYNSGSVPSNNDLGGPGATRCYCSDIANRLMGWLNAKKTCTLDG